MTEYSWNFACTPAAGDAGPLTAEALAAARLFLGNFDPQGAGVIYWTDGTPANTLFPGTPPGLSGSALDGLLAPSNPSGGIVRIASGVGMVLGYLYVSDSDVDFDINADPGQANATDLIVLRRSSLVTTPQIRLARKKASSPSSTATLQQDATIWETALAEVLLDGSGNFSSLTNVGRLAAAPTANMVLLETLEPSAVSSITTSTIPAFFGKLIIDIEARASSLSGSVGDVWLQINSVTSGYDYLRFLATGTNLSHDYGASQSFVRVGFVTSSSSALWPNNFDSTRIIIPNYGKVVGSSSESVVCEFKGGTLGDGGSLGRNSCNGFGYMFPGSGNRVNTLTIGLDDGVARNFSSGSQIKVYGVLQ